MSAVPKIRCPRDAIGLSIGAATRRTEPTRRFMSMPRMLHQ